MCLKECLNVLIRVKKRGANGSCFPITHILESSESFEYLCGVYCGEKNGWEKRCVKE